MNGAILPGENSKWDKTCTSAPELSETPSSSYNPFWKNCADFNLYCLLKISFGSIWFSTLMLGERRSDSLLLPFSLGPEDKGLMITVEPNSFTHNKYRTIENIN